jgi:hypothetical protein
MSAGISFPAVWFLPALTRSRGVYWSILHPALIPFWISDNGAGVSTLYNTAGTPQPLIVSIPSPGNPLGTMGTPTRIVFNTASGKGAFAISGFTKTGLAVTAPAVFLWATEDGTILGGTRT